MTYLICNRDGKYLTIFGLFTDNLDDARLFQTHTKAFLRCKQWEHVISYDEAKDKYLHKNLTKKLLNYLTRDEVEKILEHNWTNGAFPNTLVGKAVMDYIFRHSPITSGPDGSVSYADVRNALQGFVNIFEESNKFFQNNYEENKFPVTLVCDIHSEPDCSTCRVADDWERDLKCHRSPAESHVQRDAMPGANAALIAEPTDAAPQQKETPQHEPRH